MSFTVLYLPDTTTMSDEYCRISGFDTEQEATEWSAENRWCYKCRDEYHRMKAGVPSSNPDNYDEIQKLWYYDTPCDCEWVIIDEDMNTEDTNDSEI
jgi:hypothetical protein